ncbi:MAG TPA: MBL fold metallo-hydrolase [Firmicutes bacterium]|nr:MBL fold metallo-hydrolase [Bacillota bacterium]
MQITGHLWLVGSGRMGFDLSDPLDCHVYLLAAGEERILIDAGAGYDTTQLLANIDETLGGGAPTRLFLTHKHVDHSGGAAVLKERYGLEIWASAHTAEAVVNADRRLICLDEAIAAGLYPPDMEFQACSIDHILNDGDEVRIGGEEGVLTIKALSTPGHCDGHLSFLVDGYGYRMLFSGDSIFCGGRVAWQAIYDCSITEHIESIRKMQAADFSALLPGHLTFSLRRGKRHLEAALAAVNRLRLPPHLT